MSQLINLIPIAIGTIIALVLAVKIFRDSTTNNYIGYMLVAAVVLSALPGLQNFSYKGALGEVSGNLTGQIATQSATLAADISELKANVRSIATKINAPTELPSNPEAKKNTVLIFYGTGKSELANQIRNYLLNEGYKASATFTDFSELGSNILTAGSNKMTFTPESANLALQMNPKLRSKFPQLTNIVDSNTARLNNGDIQLQLF
jgi:hypothetical protein